jgi:hypothetical protein
MPFNKRRTTAAAAKFAGSEFVERVKQSSPKARSFGREAAVARFQKITRTDKDSAERFYDSVKAALAGDQVVLNMEVDDLSQFLSKGEFSQSGSSGKFNHLTSKRAQAERAIGCHGLAPVYANISKHIEGDRSLGNCSVILSGIGDRTVLVSGDLARLRNQASPDFIADPTLVLYSGEDISDCRAAAAIMALPDRTILSGTDVALRELVSQGTEYGCCEALIFGGIDTSCISRIVVDSDDMAVAVRVALDTLHKVCPITVSKQPITVYGHSADPMEPAAPKSVPQQHFKSGDRVAMKPGPTSSNVRGTILAVDNGNVTIQWDNSQHGVYDMAEALMRVMAAPEEPQRIDGMVAYSLPGMDNETVLALSTLGIDPVSVYTIASHGQPASPSAEWWEDRLIQSLKGMGINAYVAKGFVKNSSEDSLAFVPHKWLEARLPGGSRLVMDVGPQSLTIRAGDPEDYVLPSPDSSIVFE